jgi:TRAP-type C4-dicarboxylate transport system permease small subunit
MPNVPDVDLSGMSNPAPRFNGIDTIGGLLTGGGFNLLNLLFVIIGLIFFLNLIMAGWDYMLSTGDPKKISTATTRFVNGFIGLTLAITAFLIVRIVTTALGLNNLI